jgi:tetratricopeptide (TPR) repeat protein
LGEFSAGIRRAEEAVRIAEAVTHSYSLSVAYRTIGISYVRKGEFHRAIPALERALHLCQTANIPSHFPRIASPLGTAYALAGRMTEALPLLEQAVEQSASIRRNVQQALWMIGLSEGYGLAGRLEDARDLAERALAVARAHHERGSQAWALRLLGEIAAQRESAESPHAEACYHQALALAAELGMRPLMAHCHRGLGLLSLQRGRGAQARPELTAAMALYRAMDMTFWLSQIEAALAQIEQQ